MLFYCWKRKNKWILLLEKDKFLLIHLFFRHAGFFKEHVIPQAKGYYSYDQSHAPDHWFEPVQVFKNFGANE